MNYKNFNSQPYLGSGHGSPPTKEEALLIANAMEQWETLPKTEVGCPILGERELNGKRQRFISHGNHGDPRSPQERFNIDEDPEQTRKWLDGFVHGDPLHNELYTSKQLKDMGLIGLYKWRDIPEDEDIEPTAVVNNNAKGS